MSRFSAYARRPLVLFAAVLALSLGSAIQGQTLSPSSPPPAGELPRRDKAGAAPAPASTNDVLVKRYKVSLHRSDSSTTGFESWIVFDVIEDTKVILLRHATTNGYGKWWDHPVLSGMACRIIKADGGDQLVDCKRASLPGPGAPLQIVLPQGAFLQHWLLTFTWKENGKIQEEMLRIEKGLIPDTRRTGQTQKPQEIRQSYVQPSGLTPGTPRRGQTQKPEESRQSYIQPRGPASGNWRYKVKLSEGNSWQNLQPESWMVFDAIGGTTVALMHSTKVSDILTGINRWWDHPVLSIKACPLINGDRDDRQAGCIIGSSAVPGEPLKVMLPEGSSLHDFSFSFTWEERGRIHAGVTIVDRLLQPVPLP